MAEKLRPNEAEREFLNLAYNRFYDLFAEVMSDDFWARDDLYRFSRISSGFATYSETMNYEPIKWTIEESKTKRPPAESEIATDLFRFVRNTLVHFPFFDRWDDVWISGNLANWSRADQSIDRFLRTYAGRPEVKYRFWEREQKKMTYIQIRFPGDYSPKAVVHLKDILEEKDGSKFSFILMRSIMDSQVLTVTENS